jgi:hypothetical protein
MDSGGVTFSPTLPTWGALLVLAFAFFPFLRGAALICTGMGVLFLVGFIAYRVTQRRSGASRSESELVGQFRAIDWFHFEKVVAVVCRKLDYAVTRRGGANPDGGIDLLLEKNCERRAIQCKHWKTRQVGVRHVREFLGALADAGVQKGSFVTLDGCTAEAQALAERHDIEVIDESQLAAMLKAVDAAQDHARPDRGQLVHVGDQQEAGIERRGPAGRSARRRYLPTTARPAHLAAVWSEFSLWRSIIDRLPRRDENRNGRPCSPARTRCGLPTGSDTHRRLRCPMRPLAKRG